MRANRIAPGPGQESVWDYPRPARWENCSERIRVIFNDIVIADTLSARRVLETSHPPVYYVPSQDVQMQYLEKSNHKGWCEWKGHWRYYHLRVGERLAKDAAWFYPEPASHFSSLQDHVAFYASKMDACFVGEEQVTPQPGNFYGGWVTSNIVGPFKGGVGTIGW